MNQESYGIRDIKLAVEQSGRKQRISLRRTRNRVACFNADTLPTFFKVPCMNTVRKMALKFSL